MNISQQLKRKRDREHLTSLNRPSTIFYESEDGEISYQESEDYLTNAVTTLNTLEGDLELVAGDGIEITSDGLTKLTIGAIGGVGPGPGPKEEIVPRRTDDPIEDELSLDLQGKNLYINKLRLLTEQDLRPIENKLDKIIELIKACCNGGGEEPGPGPDPEKGYIIGYGLKALNWSSPKDTKEKIYDIGYNVIGVEDLGSLDPGYQYGYKLKDLKWDITLIEKPKEE